MTTKKILTLSLVHQIQMSSKKNQKKIQMIVMSTKSLLQISLIIEQRIQNLMLEKLKSRLRRRKSYKKKSREKKKKMREGRKGKWKKRLSKGKVYLVDQRSFREHIGGNQEIPRWSKKKLDLEILLVIMLSTSLTRWRHLTLLKPRKCSPLDTKLSRQLDNGASTVPSKWFRQLRIIISSTGHSQVSKMPRKQLTKVV